jgi:hypothetical protein
MAQAVFDIAEVAVVAGSGEVLGVFEGAFEVGGEEAGEEGCGGAFAEFIPYPAYQIAVDLGETGEDFGEEGGGLSGVEA